MARRVTTIFEMRENYTKKMKQASAATKKFQRQVQAAARKLDQENAKRRKIELDSKPANKTLNALRAQMQKVKNLRINVAARMYNFKRDIRPVTDGLRKFIRKPVVIGIKLKDMAMGGLRKILNLTKTLARKLIIPVTITVAGVAKALKEGLKLDEYEVGVEHFIGVNSGGSPAEVKKKSKAYFDWLREYAALTPYGMDEILSAGQKAVSLTGGDLPAARGFMKIIGDVAAAHKGSVTLADTYEAFQSAVYGNYRSLKSNFGINLTDEMVKKAGGDIFAVKMANGMTIPEYYKDMAVKQSKTPAGLWSTMTGNIEDGVQQAGKKMLDRLQPFLLKMLPYSEQLGEKIGDLGDMLGGWIVDTIPKLKQFGEDFKAALDPLSVWLTKKWDMLKPFRDFVRSSFDGLTGKGENIMSNITDGIDSLVNTLIKSLNWIAENWKNIEPVLGEVVRFIPTLVKSFVAFKVAVAGFKVAKGAKTIWNALGNLFGGKGFTPPSPIGTSPVPPAAAGAPASLGIPAAAGAASKLPWPGDLTLKGLWGGAAGSGGATAGSIAAGGLIVGGIASAGYALGHTFFTKEGRADLKAQFDEAREIEEAYKEYRKKHGLKDIFRPLPASLWDILTGKYHPKKVDYSSSSGRAYSVRSGSLDEIDRQRADIKNKPVEVPAKVKPDLSVWEAAKQKITEVISVAVRPVIADTPTTNDAKKSPSPGGRMSSVVLEKKAAGIKRVPFDNYPALLHKGEAVLPSGEAGAYRDRGNRAGGTTVQATININGANMDGRSLARLLVSELQAAAFNAAPA